MKIPSIRTVERVVNLIPAVKELIPKHSTEDTGLLAIIKKQEDELHNKKAEIYTLRKQIEQLQETVDKLVLEFGEKLQGNTITNNKRITG